MIKPSPAIQFYRLTQAPPCSGQDCGYVGIALAATGVTSATQVIVGGLLGALAGSVVGRGKGRAKEGAFFGFGLAVASEVLTPQIFTDQGASLARLLAGFTAVGFVPAAVGIGIYHYSRSERNSS